MPIPPDTKAVYADLCSPPQNADAVWRRNRGYRFERVLAEILRADGLEPRTSYKAPGEQIDGSFFLDGTVFLLEAKWHEPEVPASSLYQFKGKVDGKLAGTLGVFVSMSGYSEDAVDALTLGKSLNLILFDKQDIDAAIVRDLGFREVLKRKLRAAAEEGVVYLPIEASRITPRDSEPVEIEQLEFDHFTGEVYTKAAPSAEQVGTFILCEGTDDSEVLGRLARRILREQGKEISLQTITARGKVAIPRLANALRNGIAPKSKFIIVVDSDGDVSGTRALLEQKIEFSGWVAAIPDPEIETWLGFDRASISQLGPMSRLMKAYQAAEEIDLQKLRASDREFEVFYRALSET